MACMLPEQHRPYCMHRVQVFTTQAKRIDPIRWQRLEAALGRPPLIWEYTEYKLRTALAEKKSPGQAAWAWQAQGNLCRGFICVYYCSDASQQAPYVPGEPVEWWPIVWLETDSGAVIFPMMCPALAWQDSRPWSVHCSRTWHCPAHWLHDIDGFSEVSSTSSGWELLPSTGGSAISVLTGWTFAAPVAPEPGDIAVLEDVDSDTTSLAGWTEVSEVSETDTTASSTDSTAAPSSNAGPRKRRWGK